jgi:DNA mismatch repair ATPase MutS
MTKLSNFCAFVLQFKTNELSYYRSPRTKELDAVLGDCLIAILNMETSIMIFLAELVISQSSLLLKIGSSISELDWYVSFL